MKILYISGSLPPIKDGVSEWSEQLINELKMKHIISILRTPNMNRISGVHEIIIEKFNSIKIFNYIKGIDLVHIEYPCIGYGKNNFYINLLPLFLKLTRKKIKISIMVHEFSSYSIKGKLRCLIMMLFSDFLFTSDMVNKYQIEQILKKEVVKLSIKSQIPINNKQIQEKEKLIIGYWGFIREDKGFELILDVLSEVRKSYPNICLNILSELNFDNSYHQKILEKIKNLYLEDITNISGYLDENNLSKEIVNLDICLLPYKDGLTEKRGTFMAAMANGVCVITTAPIIEIEGLKNGYNVILADYNKNDYVKKLLYLIENRAKINEIGENAAKWYKNRAVLNLEKFEKRIIDFKGDAK